MFSWSMCLLRGELAPSLRHDGTPWTTWDAGHRLAAGTRLPWGALLQVGELQFMFSRVLVKGKHTFVSEVAPSWLVRLFRFC